MDRTRLLHTDPFSRDVLEFYGILDLLRHFLSGPLSAPALEAVEPRAQAAAIQRDLELAKEAREYLSLSPRPRLTGLADPRAILEKLRVDGVSCSALEISSVVEAARTACHSRELFAKTACTRLNALARSVAESLDGLVRELEGKILPDGSVDSSASPALARIRRSMARVRQELQSTLERLLRRLAEGQVLQEELITLRNGRFVLPVRAEKKRAVQGIVHGASSSGASLYVEPLETLPLNNELIELQEREAAETLRILAAFSDKLRSQRQELLDATAALSELDLAFAKAEFTRQYNACFPEFTAARELVLRKVRHPLLQKALQSAQREPVPLTIELREPEALMVISGPNTGGKTVALKTIGVAVLMAQSGLPVTAEKAELPLFTRVLADIGDQQSIEQDLSTFSAHIRNIQAMVQVAGCHDLVLLDEIGGSTDPQEGAALAVAILERFRHRGSMTFVSTHHSRLKAYATETPQAINAAMDFDERDLRPTYKFLIGLPGKSSGLDIAQRLGLDSSIVEKARSLLDPAQAEAAALVASLHAKRSELEGELARVHERARELEKRDAEIKQAMAAERQAKLRELDQRLEATLREYDTKWKAALAELRKEAQAEAKSTKAPAKAGRRSEKLGSETRDDWNVQVLETLGGPARPEQGTADLPAAVGDRVRLNGLLTPGVVIAILEGDRLEVEVGRLRMRVRKDEARVLAPRRADAGSSDSHRATEKASERSALFANPPAMSGSPDLPSSGSPSYRLNRGTQANAENPETLTEISLIGNTAEEARERVDEFLDRAFLAGHFKLRIVHGYGKGVLKKNLRQMFASHPHVERFYPAPQREGGDGATIVELKR